MSCKKYSVPHEVCVTWVVFFKLVCSNQDVFESKVQLWNCTNVLNVDSSLANTQHYPSWSRRERDILGYFRLGCRNYFFPLTGTQAGEINHLCLRNIHPAQVGKGRGDSSARNGADSSYQSPAHESELFWTPYLNVTKENMKCLTQMAWLLLIHSNGCWRLDIGGMQCCSWNVFALVGEQKALSAYKVPENT